MGFPGAVPVQSVAAALAVLLVVSSPGMALLSSPGAPGAPLGGVDPDLPDPEGLLDELDPLTGFASTGLPGPHEDLTAWLEWTTMAPLEVLESQARDHVPLGAQQVLPSPDAFTAHTRADADAQRAAWQSWWLAAMIVAYRQPSVALDPVGALPANSGATGHNGQGNQTGIVQPMETDSPVGDPHSLERLWRLQAHGPPRLLLPAGDGEETYLVTDRGVLFLPEPGSRPDWMLHLDGVAGHAEVIDKPGRKDLVIGMHTIHQDTSTPSIWVIDGDQEAVRFSGLRGERALLYWGLTDVDGDGDKDILGVDRSGNITAVKLDGSEIYRTPVPQPDLPEEEIPLPDLPELPEYLALALTRTGIEVLGDATGDGTLDIFTPSWWGAAGMQNLIAISLVEGKSGDIVWTQIIEPATDIFFRMTVPTLTGDLNGDGHDDVHVWDFHSGFFGATITNLYLGGQQGLLLARDSSNFWIDFGIISTAPYIPLAFVDLDGDGTKQIISMAAWAFSVEPYMHVRTILPVPGLPTLTTHAQWFEDWLWVPASALQHSVIERDGKEVFQLLAPHWVTFDGHAGSLVTVDDADGIQESELPRAIGHYTVNPQTGQRYAWTLSNDRWTPVDAALQPTTNGTRLIMSANPILLFDQDGDGTPDLLIPRSMGYFWVSGRTGAIIDQVDRPMTTTFMTTSAHDDGFILERDAEHYILYDVIAKETAWMISRSVGEDANVRGLADFTGDGKLEILFRDWEWVGWNSQEEWRIYSQALPGTIWSQETEDGRAEIADLHTGRDGFEILLLDYDDGESTQLRVYTPGDEDGHLQWSSKRDHVDTISVIDGHMATAETGDETRILVFDGEDGKQLHLETLGSGEEINWIRLIDDDGSLLLVYAYTVQRDDHEHDLHEHIRVIDVKEQTRLTDFQITDPITHVEQHAFFGYGFTSVWHEKSHAGPSVGDWSGNGHVELALREANWPVVRTLADGEIVAVGPTRGSFTFSVDLNNDGRQELALSTGGSLRLYAFDASRGQMAHEDPLARTELVDPDEGDNETLERFFEPREERSPAPPVVLLLALVGLLGALGGAFGLRRTKE